MLSKEFLRAIVIALVIALPLAGWMMHNWLSGFAWHINLGIDIFLVTGLAMIALTLCTVSFQAIQAALANPAKSLDSE